LLGTSITIKGVLPLRSTQLANEDPETSLLEANIATLEPTSSIQPREAIEESNNPSQVESLQERASSSSVAEKKREIEIAKQNAIGAWKVVLSYLRSY